MRALVIHPTNPVHYKTRIRGRVHPRLRIKRVQLLVRGDDMKWYLQKDAVLRSGGHWTVESTFGFPDSVHQFDIVAVAGCVIKESPLDTLPTTPYQSGMVTVTRLT